MPRKTAQPPAPPETEPANSLVASAASVTRDGSSAFTKKRGLQAWQSEAWAFYDSIGELRAAANWIGNALSRIRLVIKHKDSEGSSTLKEGLAVDALAGLFGGESGQSQMLEALGIHLTVPGEAYLVAEPQSGDLPDAWMVCSTEEVTNTTGSETWSVNRGDGKRELKKNCLVIRVWRPHPRKWVEADSSVRAVLPILREIQALTKRVAADIDSRLAGAGLLLLPSEMSFVSPPKEGEDPANAQDPFFDALLEAMMTPIEDRESAAAVVPLVVRAPGALLSTAQHITFSTPFDAQSQSLREEGIKRTALGMDLPPEIMLGTGNANHWSAWQIDESAIKIHVEPLMELVCDAFTQKWLWPVLEAAGEIDYGTTVGWDTADLRVRPNHAQEAIELYDRGQLSPDALRRETGFEDSDRPNDDEQKTMLLLKLALANSDLSAGAVRALGLDIAPEDVGNRYQPVPPPQVEPPTGRDRNLPQEDQSRAAAALVAVEMVVLRALERANNRLNRRSKQTRSCSDTECSQGLQGAWANVPRLAEVLSVSPDWLETQLDGYTRSVLTGEFEHCPEALRDYLFDVKVLTHV